MLKIRPIGSVDATVADHPGMAVLEAAGVCQSGSLDTDVAELVHTLGRPDIEVDIVVSRPESAPGTPAGPVTPFEPPTDPLECAEALAQWNSQRSQRAVALCRRDGNWAAAARLWRTGANVHDEVVVSALAQAPTAATVGHILGNTEPARFHGINIEAAALEPAVNDWLTGRHPDIVGRLTSVGLSVPQARIIEAIGDAGTTRAVMTAAQFTLDGPCWASLGITVADTSLGRVVITNALGPDGRQWTTVLPGSADAVRTAVDELLESLPCGHDWMNHQRIPHSEFA